MSTMRAVALTFVTACSIFLLAALSLYVFHYGFTTQGFQGTHSMPVPSRTAGHHGGALAGVSVANNNDQSYLQSGGDGSPDDYLISCNNSNNGQASRAGVYDNYAGWHFVNDSYGGGCSAKEFWFNGEKHDINGGHVSWH